MRGDTHDGEGFLQFFFASACHPSTQMCCLHRSRTAACNHQEAQFGKSFAHSDDLNICFIEPRETVPAHYSDQLMFVETREEILQAIAYGVVVKRSRQRFLNVCRVLSLLQVMPIYTPIVALLVAVWVCGIEAFVEFLWRIEVIWKAEFLAHIGQKETIP